MSEAFDKLKRGCQRKRPGLMVVVPLIGSSERKRECSLSEANAKIICIGLFYCTEHDKGGF